MSCHEGPRQDRLASHHEGLSPRAWSVYVCLSVVMVLFVCRQAEHEADAIGIRLLAKACYDPRANLSMLYKLEQQEKDSGDDTKLSISVSRSGRWHRRLSM
jgi:predicted Zn-dependent protease